MPYDELLNSGRIRKESFSPEVVDRSLARAERDLKAAAKMLSEDLDWAFAMAYNAVLQAARAYMFAQGYRPASTEGHKNTFAFMSEAAEIEEKELISYFDRMRVKRHRATYEIAGLITETEAANLLEKAEGFVSFIKGKLESGT
jgi:uncharacterized protein (UPF0332 family)